MFIVEAVGAEGLEVVISGHYFGKGVPEVVIADEDRGKQSAKFEEEGGVRLEFCRKFVGQPGDVFGGGGHRGSEFVWRVRHGVHAVEGSGRPCLVLGAQRWHRRRRCRGGRRCRRGGRCRGGRRCRGCRCLEDGLLGGCRGGCWLVAPATARGGHQGEDERGNEDANDQRLVHDAHRSPTRVSPLTQGRGRSTPSRRWRSRNRCPSRQWCGPSR